MKSSSNWKSLLAYLFGNAFFVLFFFVINAHFLFFFPKSSISLIGNMSFCLFPVWEHSFITATAVVEVWIDDLIYPWVNWTNKQTKKPTEAFRCF